MRDLPFESLAPRKLSRSELGPARSEDRAVHEGSAGPEGPAPHQESAGPEDPAPHEEPDPAPHQAPPLPEFEDLSALRAEAARFAAIACARAMRRSLAHYPRLIDRFVDDALRACGRPRRAIVRVNPGDAENVTPRDGVEIVADEAVEPGACSVDTPAGRLGASVEQRAMRLAQAAAEHA